MEFEISENMNIDFSTKKPPCCNNCTFIILKTLDI